jgi:hypothetical protein
MTGDSDHTLSGLDIELARRIDAVCRRIDADWRAGGRPLMDEYLMEVPDPARAALRVVLAPRRQPLRP